MIETATIFDFLLEPWSSAIDQRALLEMLLLAPVAGVLGVWVNLGRMPYAAESLSHAALPGLALASIAGLPLIVGAAPAMLLAAVAIALISTKGGIERDSSIAVVVTLFFGAGVIVGLLPSSPPSLQALMFGDLLALNRTDIVLAAALSLITLVAALAMHRRLALYHFDTEGAAAAGIRPAALNALLAILVAGSVLVAVQGLGSLLVAAVLIAPAAAARKLASRLATTMLLATVLAAIAAVGGLYISYFASIAAGPAIVLTATSVYLLALLTGRVRRVASLSAATVLLLAAFVGGCGGQARQAEIVATTPQVADLVRNVAGGRVDVGQVAGLGADPHEFEPSAAQVEQISKAKLVITSGGVDDWAKKLVEQSGSGAKLVVLEDYVPVKIEAGGGIDPHWWLDPVNARAAVAKIADVLEREYPRDASYFQRKARSYRAMIATVQKKIERCFKQIPKERRKVITDHDSLVYFTNRFKLDLAGAVLPSQSTQAQPSAADMKRLAQLVRDQNVRTVFPESNLSPKLVEALARESGAQVGGKLYTDTLGPKGSKAGTYLGMMRENAGTIVRGHQYNLYKNCL